MFCPNCGKENANTSSFCNSCGRPLATPPAASTPAATPGPAAAPGPAVAPGPVAPGPRPVIAPGPTGTPGAPYGYAPQPSSYGPQASEPGKRNTGIIVIVAVAVLAAFAAGGYYILSNQNTEKPEEHVSRLFREASGLQPVKKYSFFAKYQKFDEAFRNQFRTLIETNKEMQTRLAQIDKSGIPSLGRPETIADPSAAGPGLQALHALLDLEKEMGQKVRQIAEGIRSSVESSDLSAADKAEFMKGFEIGLTSSLEKRDRLINAESAYVASTDDLYNFANTNHSQIQLNGSQLVITDPQLLDAFNSKVREYNSTQTEMLRAQEDFTRAQRDILNKVGVGSKDVGLPTQ